MAPSIFSDCKHLILPSRCQCYHSGEQSELRCHNIGLDSVPKLTNNMRWYALDFSLNKIQSIESYVFSDIYVEKLDLRSNYLQRIELTAFDQIKNLRQLFIDHNQLKQFNPAILTSPGVSLELFDISYNPIGFLDLGEMFLRLSVLEEFHAVSCQLNNASLFTLLKLTERHNHIKIIDLSYNNLTSLCNNLFDNFYNLVELRLNNNNIYLIDNYFIRSLNYIRTINLAFNSIEYFPNIFSSSLENLNVSSNNIRYLSDYFISNLRSIRFIDFDSNKYLSSISPRSFCFVNTNTLKKLSFRFNNILLLNTFYELLCNLFDMKIHQNTLDLNHNANLQCNCMLVQFQTYLFDYFDLTCTHQGQDRYFISNFTNASSNCTSDICVKPRKEYFCEWLNAEKLILEGTCLGNLLENENSTKNETDIIEATINLNITFNISHNSTIWYDNRTISIAISIKTVDYIWFIIFTVYLAFHRFLS